MSRRYLVILKDTQGVPDFLHPSDIMGESAQQVRSIITQDTPAEYIQGIYTPQEYLEIVQSPKFAQIFSSFNADIPQPAIKKVIAQLTEMVKSYIEPGQENVTNDMAALANMVNGNNTEENFDLSTQVPPKPQQQAKPIVTVVSQPVKYFTESGIKFKLENGELYKKEWTDTPIEPYMDKVTDPKTGEEKEVEIIPDFRLVNKETGKPVKLSKYVLQQAVWKKLES